MEGLGQKILHFIQDIIRMASLGGRSECHHGGLGKIGMAALEKLFGSFLEPIGFDMLPNGKMPHSNGQHGQGMGQGARAVPGGGGSGPSFRERINRRSGTSEIQTEGFLEKVDSTGLLERKHQDGFFPAGIGDGIRGASPFPRAVLIP